MRLHRAISASFALARPASDPASGPVWECRGSRARLWTDAPSSQDNRERGIGRHRQDSPDPSARSPVGDAPADAGFPQKFAEGL